MLAPVVLGHPRIVEGGKRGEETECLTAFLVRAGSVIGTILIVGKDLVCSFRSKKIGLFGTASDRLATSEKLGRQQVANKGHGVDMHFIFRRSPKREN